MNNIIWFVCLEYSLSYFGELMDYRFLEMVHVDKFLTQDFEDNYENWVN